MSSVIHPTAIVSPGAQIGIDCLIGPFCTIGENVTIGDRVQLDSHVVVDGKTGFLVNTLEEMCEETGHLGEIDPHACRAYVADTFSVARMTDGYLGAYDLVLRASEDEASAGPPPLFFLTERIKARSNGAKPAGFIGTDMRRLPEG